MSAKTVATCPFCGATMLPNDNQADFYVRRYGTHYSHPDNRCYLADTEICPSEVGAWNERSDGEHTRAERAEAALRDAAYALFQIKRMVPEAVREFASNAHVKACTVLDNGAIVEGEGR